jgi:hypothetical protein
MMMTETSQPAAGTAAHTRRARLEATVDARRCSAGLPITRRQPIRDFTHLAVARLSARPTYDWAIRSARFVGTVGT